MAKMTLKGFEEYEAAISRLSKDYKDEVAGAVIYAGADVVADAVRKSIESLPIVKGYGTEKHPLPGGVTQSQKDGLLVGFGISKMQNTGGSYNVKLGFDGYNSTTTEKFPNGQPNQLVARGVESGTSWKRKHPFVRPAVTKATKPAVEKMKTACDDACAKVMGK